MISCPVAAWTPRLKPENPSELFFCLSISSAKKTHWLWWLLLAVGWKCLNLSDKVRKILIEKKSFYFLPVRSSEFVGPCVDHFIT